MSTPEELQVLSWKSCEHSISYLFLFSQALVYRPYLSFCTVFKADKFSVHNVKRILLFKFSSLSQRLFSQNAGGDTQLHFYC